MANIPGRGQRWWQSWPAIILGLLLCLPVGLVGLWTRPALGTKVRLWLTGGAAAFLVVVLASQGESPAPQAAPAPEKSTTSSAPHRTPSPDHPTPTPSITPSITPAPAPIPELASVPDLTGLGAAEAIAALKAAGLTVGSVTSKPTDGAPHLVLSQGAAAGSRVEPGTVVDVVIASPLPKVPDVVGLAKAVAQSRLASAGFTVTIAITATTSGADGVVLSQEPGASARAARGTAVHLTVAELHKPPQVASNCTPGYSPCLPPASDYDCAGGSGNGPEYADGPITVTGSDPYGLDADGDGIGCE